MTLPRMILSRRAFAPTMSALSLSLGACRSKGDPEMRATAIDADATSDSSASTADRTTAAKPISANSQQEKPEVANLEKWNFPQLPWTTKTSALSRMKSVGKPGLVVIKGEWCPHCRKYAELFSDPEVAKLTTNFELILLESDSKEAAQWGKTGTYVPRTLFLDPQGQLDASFAGPNPRFPYFFSANDKAEFVSAMKQARIKYGS